MTPRRPTASGANRPRLLNPPPFLVVSANEARDLLADFIILFLRLASRGYDLARRRLLAWREEVRVGVLFRQRSSGLVGQGEQVIALYEGRRTNYPRAPYPYRPPAPLTCARRPTSRTQRPSPFARARPCAREL